MVLESAWVLQVENSAETTAVNFLSDDKSVVNHVRELILFVFEIERDFLF
jgi:hypothetical protein